MVTSMVQWGLLPPRRPCGFGQTVEVRGSPSELPEQGRRDAWHPCGQRRREFWKVEGDTRWDCMLTEFPVLRSQVVIPVQVTPKPSCGHGKPHQPACVPEAPRRQGCQCLERQTPRPGQGAQDHGGEQRWAQCFQSARHPGKFPAPENGCMSPQACGRVPTLNRP
jgi:hypothetical protein